MYNIKMSDLTFNDLNNMTDLLHANKYENLNVFHYKTCNYNSPKTLKEARGVRYPGRKQGVNFGQFFIFLFLKNLNLTLSFSTFSIRNFKL